MKQFGISAGTSSANVDPSHGLIDLTDGTWSVYDPSSRLRGSVSLVDGHKNWIKFNSGWSSTAGNYIGTSVTFYRKIQHYTTHEVADERSSYIWRGNLWQTSPIDLGTTKQTTFLIGVASGPPTTSSSIFKVFGASNGNASSQFTTKVVYGTAASTTASDGGSSYGNKGRGVSVTWSRSNNQFITTLHANFVSGMLDDPSNTNTLFTNTNNPGVFGPNVEAYEWIVVGANAAGSVTRDFYLSGQSGLYDCSNDKWCFASKMSTNYKNVWCLGDSTFFGTSYVPPYLIRATEEFLMRTGWSSEYQGIRFVAPSTATITASTAGAHGFISGNNVFSPVSGNKVSTIVTNIATNIAQLVTDGVTPDEVYMCCGQNDITTDGRTALQVLTDVQTIVNAIKTQWPSCKVYIITPTRNRSSVSNYAETELYALAIQNNTTLTNVTGTINWRDWWSDKFRHSSTDGHPKVPQADPTAFAAWDSPLAMDPAGTDYTQNGMAALGYSFAWALTGLQPPLLSTEVAPFSSTYGGKTTF